MNHKTHDMLLAAAAKIENKSKRRS